ncbi:MAG: hypothetical protein SGJ19_01495 [Planctomycetia bacterium]|nr:hypothetical protein [Planctomycetia bacterium]
MVNIQLDDSVAASLASLASAQGLTLEQYLRDIATLNRPDHSNRPAVDEIISDIEEASSASGSPFRGTYPRDVIYQDHD